MLESSDEASFTAWDGASGASFGDGDSAGDGEAKNPNRIAENALELPDFGKFFAASCAVVVGFKGGGTKGVVGLAMAPAGVGITPAGVPDGNDGGICGRGG
jgi:hypothetical protein